jgi:Zn-dependent peptidase ImmA (M78 family)/transcriptional regulator with XRE-family HTH domain
MPLRVSVKPSLLEWARERAGLSSDDVASKFPNFDDWRTGSKKPTLKQLERFAHTARVPIGYLFFQEPPEEWLPVPDFRTMGDLGVRHPSPDLLETVYLCQERQDWYRDYARVHQEGVVPYVGSLTLDVRGPEAAETIRTVLSFAIEERGSNWTQALHHLIDRADQVGILVMVSGVVGSNTHRKLDPREFRGFALSDQYAPVIFLNGADTKAAQIFTMAHELAHIWLGESGVDDVDMTVPSSIAIERWCNEVAAEMLIPASLLRDVVIDPDDLTDELNRLARRFKVSTLVVLRRLRDTERLTAAQFRAAYAIELARVMALLATRTSGGGDFYNTQPARVSKRFARALIGSTREGQTLHRDAFQMLGFKKLSTFNELALRLGEG